MKKFRDVLTTISLILVIFTLLPLCMIFWRSFERGYYEIPLYLDGHLEHTVRAPVTVGGSLTTKTPIRVQVDQR